MEGKGSLGLDLLDVYGDHLPDRFDVFMQHTVLSDAPVLKNQDGTKRLLIENLDSTQGGTYRLLVYPIRYRPIGCFVRIAEETTVNLPLTIPITPDRVTRVDFPTYAALPDNLRHILDVSEVVGNPGLHGEALFLALDNIRRAGLLNLYWKMQHTTFPGGQSVFSYVTALTNIRGDRSYATVPAELREAVINSVSTDLFEEADGGSHTAPFGFVLVDSYKTFDHYGNLQLTFFNKPGTVQFIVDADIDDARGIEHIFQVLRNTITGKPTHPYDIHEILLASQKLDPHYKLFA